MSEFLSLDPDALSIPERHGYLLTAVAPRPIAMATTIDKEGNINLSPFSFFNVFSSNPPIMIFSPARRGRDNTTKHTLENVKEVKECTISIVNYPMVEQTSLSSGEYAKGVNEYIKAGFTQVESDLVKTPRIGESPVSFECKVQDIISLGEEGAAGNLVICKVVKIHIRKEYLDENNKLDTRKLDLVGRMGGIYYNRASGDSLFEIPKPTAAPGIGVDSLPGNIVQSKILSANNVARLAALETLPSEEELFKAKSSREISGLALEYREDRDQFITSVHHKAKDMIENGKTKEALGFLLSIFDD